MKVCDFCGTKDGKHTEVGSASLTYSGFHYNHWTHRDASNNWNFDVCPNCASNLKNKISDIIKSLIGGK